MIVFLETAKETGVNWTAISAIGTILAALSSWIAIIFAYKTNKKSNDIAHAEIKPSFMVQSIFERRAEKIAEITVINKGYKDLKGKLNVYWKGDLGVKLESDETLKTILNDKIGFNILLNYNETTEPNSYKGFIILKYKDILGKEYKEKLDVEIEYIYSEVTESYMPIINHVIRPFE